MCSRAVIVMSPYCRHGKASGKEQQSEKSLAERPAAHREFLAAQQQPLNVSLPEHVMAQIS